MSKLISFTVFSKELLESGDIDPDYVFIRDFSDYMKWKRADMLRWILLKTVIYRSTSELEVMLLGKDFDEVKYGNERNKHKNSAYRFFSNISSFIASYPPEVLCEAPNALQMISNVQGFGPWARWKLVDLFSCCMGIHFDLSKVDFREAYEFPLKGLLLVNDMPEELSLLKPDQQYKSAMKSAWKQMPKVKRIPHNGNSGIRINELETLLCKYHSYAHGHYYPGKDLEHLKKDIAESKIKQLKKFTWSI